jgi:hypothetical protein
MYGRDKVYEGGFVQPVHRSGARMAKEGARESLKGPIAVFIYVLLGFYFMFLLVFSSIFSLFRKIVM